MIELYDKYFAYLLFSSYSHCKGLMDRKYVDYFSFAPNIRLDLIWQTVALKALKTNTIKCSLGSFLFYVFMKRRVIASIKYKNLNSVTFAALCIRKLIVTKPLVCKEME